MSLKHLFFVSLLCGVVGVATDVRPSIACAQDEFAQFETAAEHNQRMQWSREARFGMFITWGVYSVPAGEWKGETGYTEWIREQAHIPLDEYEQFLHQFNPVKFDADQWARLAKNAGMKYIVITTKHHDGFCLFDSQYTDYDIMSTPFKRDIMKELADACHREGIRICWYYSIMDWQNFNYGRRRDWEKDRSTAGADFEKYVAYLENQIRELTTKYGDIGVLWFDGEWEEWDHARGEDLRKYIHDLDPRIIVNNRADEHRDRVDPATGMEAIRNGRFAGDFGTPEQQIPPTRLPGLDWETCMTMNDTWGYNSHNNNWKSTEDLIHKLVDIASKGGNFLLNVGPTAEGLIPAPSVERLEAMGRWMKVNGESIYGTSASPFEKLPWGRCTQKQLPDGKARLYLHVFEWPKDGKLAVSALGNKITAAYLLANPAKVPLPVTQKQEAAIVTLAAEALDPVDTVVVLEIEGQPRLVTPH